MKPKPVRKYAQPKYPTRLEIAARPDLLRRHQPPAWRKWPELTGAAGLLLLADAARIWAADGTPKRGQSLAQSNAVAVVAPIFEHGKGRGATGCIVMAPPVFLSEEEALQVIREEMAARGVPLGTNQTTLPGVIVHRQVWSTPQALKEGTNQPARPKNEIRSEPLKTDAADPQRKVFIEFVGERDAPFWDLQRLIYDGKRDIRPGEDYDLPQTAHYVADRVKRDATTKVYFGTFYDPIAKSLDIRERPLGSLAEMASPGTTPPPGPWADAKAESRRLLRLQVQDFIKWLQAQGVI
jgi:hypothetical protein